MLTAIRNRDNKKVIAEYEEKDAGGYTCDSCGRVAILVKGLHKIDHFRHYVKGNCENEGESELHMNTKLEIFEHLKEIYIKGICLIDVEYRIDSVLRSDIFIETSLGNKIAIEVQVSSLPISEVYRRTQLYMANEIYVLWVLPFDKERFYEYWTVEKLNRFGYKYKPGTYTRDEVRFKEYELAIARLTFNYLTFWDLSKEYSETFYVLKLGKVYGDDSEYYEPNGQQVSFEGKLKKTIKSITEFQDVEFKEFKLKNIKKYSRGELYEIPARKVLIFEECEPKGHYK